MLVQTRAFASDAENDPAQRDANSGNSGNDRNRDTSGDKSGLDPARSFRKAHDGTDHGLTSRFLAGN